MRKWHNGYVLFIAVFLFHLVWIFQGLDVEDTGVHLMHQVAAFSTDIVPAGLSGMSFLTNFVGGMWLKLISVPSIPWARLGGILVFSLNALISYKILSMYFDSRRVFLIVFTSAALITPMDVTLLHYYSFPALLLTLELFVLNKLLNTGVDSRAFRIYSVLLGFMTVPIILARFPLIFIVFVPVILLSYCLIIKKGAAKAIRSAPYVIFGVFASAVILALFYRSIGFLDTYMGSTARSIGGSVAKGSRGGWRGYGMLWLLKLYALDYGRVLAYTCAACIGLFIASLVKDRLGGRKTAIIAVGLVAIGFAFATLVFGSSLGLNMRLVKIAIGMILVVSLIYLKHDRGQDTSITVLLLVSVYIMLISPIGSNTGIRKSAHGMWVALPLVLLITYELRERIVGKRLRSIFSLNALVIGLILVMCFFLHFMNNWRDCQNRFRLNTAFRYRHLRYLYSHKERVDVVDEALMQIDGLTQKGDWALMFDKIGAFYYLTETKPLFGHVWLRGRSVEEVKEMYQTALGERRYPKVFVYCKTNTSNVDWPHDRGMGSGARPKAEYLKDKYVNDLGYVLILENAAFAIYAPAANTGVDSRPVASIGES